MKEYDVVVVGSGSAMNIVEAMMGEDPSIRVAVIDKDEPGGICLTRGCIPSKILLYPAEVLRTVEHASEFGVTVDVRNVDFASVMERMRGLIGADIERIRRGLQGSENIDYYHDTAEFIAPYTMKVGGETIKGAMFLLGAGSKTVVPAIEGLEGSGYLTSDSLLGLRTLPRSLAVIGGGFIAAEYGHFFASMGSRVTVIGRNPRFLPEEEPEVSAVVVRELGKRMTILTGHEVVSVRDGGREGKTLSARETSTGKMVDVEASDILVAAGRGPNTELMHPGRAGIKTDEGGWLEVDEFLQTSQPNIWAVGDATGKFLYKHKANYDSQVVYYNAVLKQRVAADYHAIPRAVFTDPEVAAVGMGEEEAIAKLGADNVLVGFHRYEDTAKGEAMNAKDLFAKILVERETSRILGAHIVGRDASILIQEVVDAMYTEARDIRFIRQAMHIHPALSEVVERAALSLYPVEHYHHLLRGYGLEAP
jgi:mycothione reductase